MPSPHPPGAGRRTGPRRSAGPATAGRAARRARPAPGSPGCRARRGPRGVMTDGARQRVVVGHVALVLEPDAEEPLRHAGEALEGGLGVGRAGRHVDRDQELAPPVARGEDLHERVGVGERGRLGRDHDQRVGGGRREVEDVGRDAGRRVHQQDVERVLEAVDLGEQAELLVRAEARQLLEAARGRDDADARRPVDDDVLEPPFAADHVAQAERGREPEEHVEVGEPEVGVEHADPESPARQGHRQIGGEVGLADAALAARDGDHVRSAGRARGEVDGGLRHAVSLLLVRRRGGSAPGAWAWRPRGRPGCGGRPRRATRAPARARAARRSGRPARCRPW